ncbi:MAG: FtsQ-type POTRA domain-containing protein [Clostridia bacterium]|nr:FtsQ-type POTRA domain-containing protein [Clostridia bacterium]
MADEEKEKLNKASSEGIKKETSDTDVAAPQKASPVESKTQNDTKPSESETESVSEEKVSLDDLFDEEDIKKEASDKGEVTKKAEPKKVNPKPVQNKISVEPEEDPVDYSEVLASFKEKLWDTFEALLKNRKLVIAIVAVVLLISGFLFLFFSPKFRVKTIAISGNHVLSSDEIVDMIGVGVGDHIYKGVNGNILDIIRLDYGNKEKEIIAKYPYVEDIKIHADFPSNITVEVKERAKVAVIKINDGYATIDSEGIVVELSLSEDGIENYNPVICGLDISKVVIGEKIQIKNESDYQKAIIILGAVLAADVNSTFKDGYSFYESLQEIRIIPSGMIYLTFTLPSGSMLQVKLESIEKINDDMNWLVYNVRENSFEDLPDGALDMTGEEYIYREY